MSALTDTPGTWRHVVDCASLPVDRGVAVTVDGLTIALFRCGGTQPDGTHKLYAVDHRDPRTGAPVIARGLVGSVGDIDIISSPIHKERYDLATGTCLDDPELTLAIYQCQIDLGMVLVHIALA